MATSASLGAAKSKDSKPAWLWCAVKDDADFQHPGKIPQDATLAVEHWSGGCRGPRIARITPVTLLVSVKASKPNMVTIANKGAIVTVHKSHLLPWHEGLLILQELLRSSNGEKGHLNATWVSAELQRHLDMARKSQKSLAAAKYVSERLMDVAITGAQWSYRRQNVLSGAAQDVELSTEGDTIDDEHFGVEKICRYMPPWEAFCHPQCGYYQDFYQVLWAQPYGLVDYSQCENGCDDLVGATWEPDECLPLYLDRLRVQAKQAWKADKLLREAKEAKQLPAERDKEQVVEPPRKKQRMRRDGKPLSQDIFRFESGHDFVRASDEAMGNVRTGWPKSADEYPVGFGVANPPGYCREGCNCMDDQRPQHKWELKKAWVEDASRTVEVHDAIESFSNEKSFVKRHGDGKSLCYFETIEKYMYRSLQPYAKAALDLAGVFQGTLQKACAEIPLQVLTLRNEPIFFPSNALSPDNQDYCPLRLTATLENGEELPKWLEFDPATGRLSATNEALAEGVGVTRLKIRFDFTAKLTTDLSCSISSSMLERGVDSAWCKVVERAMEKVDSFQKSIDPALWAALQEQLSKLYDLRKRKPRDASLKQCLETLTRCLRMSRAASVANLTIGTVGKRLSS